MKIGVIDLDGKYPNIALMKVASYYKQLGCEVEHATIGYYDKLYVCLLYTSRCV